MLQPVMRVMGVLSSVAQTGFIILFSLGISPTSVACEFVLHFLLFLRGTDGKMAVLIGCNTSALTESNMLTL